MEIAPIDRRDLIPDGVDGISISEGLVKGRGMHALGDETKTGSHLWVEVGFDMPRQIYSLGVSTRFGG